MRKIILTAVITAMICGAAFAATTQTQTANVTVASLISIEFANTTDTTFGGGYLPWTSIEPTSSIVPPTGHVDTKVDTAVICKYNGEGNWALKIKFDGYQGLDGRLKYYMPMPFYNGVPTNGTLGNPTPGPGADWPILANNDLTVYTSGTIDRANVPLGTFVGINYGLDPRGLIAGNTYRGYIIYTIVGNL